MPYKNKFDSRYREARMCWYYMNKALHKAISSEIIRRKRDFINKLKGRPCMDCKKIFPPYVMDFDHRDKSTKRFNVALMLRQGWDKIKEEIDKCDIVCANCHRIRTYKDMAH